MLDSTMSASDSNSWDQASPNKVILGYNAKKVGMIYPKELFAVNREAMEDNLFIDKRYIDMSEEESTAMAQECFKNYANVLNENGIQTEIFMQSVRAADAVFPDWYVTARNPFLPKGVLIVASMKTLERRKERSQQVIDDLSLRYGHVIDLSKFETSNTTFDEGKFLELKGALVTDWENGKIYCNISERASEELFDYMMEELNKIVEETSELKDRRLRGVKFRAYDKNGERIYHTDCMMTLLSKHAVICSEAIKDESERETVLKELTDPKLNSNPKEIMQISFNESENMCSNMFDVLDSNNNHCVVMSERAKNNFTEENLDTLNANYKVVSSDIDIIEKIGGGSARCMLVELF